MLGDIGCDNERLTEQVSKLKPLLQYIQQVTIEASFDDKPLSRLIIRENEHGTEVHHYPSVKLEPISTVLLSQGTVVINDEGGQKIVIPITSAPQLRLENLGYVGGMRLRLANKILKFPSHELPGQATAVNIASDDTASITINFSDHISINFELHGLTNEELLNFKEKRYGAGQYTGLLMMPMTYSPYYNQGEDVIAVPTSIEMNLTPALKQTLDDIFKATTSAEQLETYAHEYTQSPSDKLLQSTVSALGDDCHKKMLQDNCLLKLQRDALASTKERVLAAELSHSEASMHFSLDEGQLMSRVDGEGRTWTVDLLGKENSSIAVDDIGDSVLSLSGTHLNESFEDNIRRLMKFRPDPPFFDLSEESVTIRIPYGLMSHGLVEIIGELNLDAHTENELEDIMDGLPIKLFMALTPRCRRRVIGDISLPRTLKFNMHRIEFQLSSVQRVLGMVGLFDEEMTK